MCTGSIQYNIGLGLIKGDIYSTLNPKENAAREEAAIIQIFTEKVVLLKGGK